MCVYICVRVYWKSGTQGGCATFTAETTHKVESVKRFTFHVPVRILNGNCNSLYVGFCGTGIGCTVPQKT